MSTLIALAVLIGGGVLAARMYGLAGAALWYAFAGPAALVLFFR